jgi:protocatechuate 3,4-dioxygenase beta subunit
MIIILVATLGTAIIIGWMGSLETPQSIGSVDVEVENIPLNDISGSERFTDTGYAKIFVSDQNGNGLAGATVVLNGCNAVDAEGKTVYGVTDASGYVEFDNIHASLRGAKVGHITVEVSKSGFGSNSSARISVIACV